MNRNTMKSSAVLTVVNNEPLQESAIEAVSGVSGWPLWLTVSMVAERLSLGKTKVYELIELAGLPVVRVGRAVRVPTARFLKWVEEFEKQGVSA
ncbi:MAG TPA: excisionase family DNA-binding protein [Ktedonobacteraceae bacterium]|nr:excisionase family DNA-binding protein [Ktedonobacteraceae bacterium]